MFKYNLFCESKAIYYIVIEVNIYCSFQLFIRENYF